VRNRARETTCSLVYCPANYIMGSFVAERAGYRTANAFAEDKSLKIACRALETIASTRAWGLSYLNLALVDVLVNVQLHSGTLLSELLDLRVVEERVGTAPVLAQWICALRKRLPPRRGLLRHFKLFDLVEERLSIRIHHVVAEEVHGVQHPPHVHLSECGGTRKEWSGQSGLVNSMLCLLESEDVVLQALSLTKNKLGTHELDSCQ
jgi:hypothetical protein